MICELEFKSSCWRLHRFPTKHIIPPKHEFCKTNLLCFFSLLSLYLSLYLPFWLLMIMLMHDVCGVMTLLGKKAHKFFSVIARAYCFASDDIRHGVIIPRVSFIIILVVLLTSSLSLRYIWYFKCYYSLFLSFSLSLSLF